MLTLHLRENSQPTNQCQAHSNPYQSDNHPFLDMMNNTPCAFATPRQCYNEANYLLNPGV